VFAAISACVSNFSPPEALASWQPLILQDWSIICGFISVMNEVVSAQGAGEKSTGERFSFFLQEIKIKAAINTRIRMNKYQPFFSIQIKKVFTRRILPLFF
jgi:hypothetical protein